MRTSRRHAAGFVLSAWVLGVAFAADAPLPAAGTWKINNWVPGESVQMSMSRSKGRMRWKHSTSYALEDLHGLNREQLRALHATVAFRLERDAGTFVFSGTTALGVAGGDFRFEPSPAFREKLAALGYATPDDEAILGMAMRDVSLEYAAEVKRLGLAEVGVDDLFSFRDRGIDVDWIRDVAGSGYSGWTARDLIRLSDHGVDGRYVKGLKASGYTGAGPEALVPFHDRGISTEFLRGLVEAGRGTVPADEVILLHDHGVSPSYVARIASAGFKDLSVEQIVRLHQNGVD